MNLKKTVLAIVLSVVIASPIIAVKYQLINNKLLPVQTPQNDQVIIDDKTIADTLITYQYKLEELESQIRRRDNEILKLKNQLKKLDEDYRKFKTYYFRSF